MRSRSATAVSACRLAGDHAADRLRARRRVRRRLPRRDRGDLPAGSGHRPDATASRATTSAPGPSFSPIRCASCPPASTSPSSTLGSAAVAGRSRSRWRAAGVLVGPDNGLLSLAAQAGGGVVDAVEISASPFRLEPVSATFHGRDIFAPVAAHLAAGVAFGDAGVPLDPDTLLGIALPSPAVADGRLTATVLGADVFGNVQLAATSAEAEALGLRVGEQVQAAPRGRRPCAHRPVRGELRRRRDGRAVHLRGRVAAACARRRAGQRGRRAGPRRRGRGRRDPRERCTAEH